MKPPVDMKRKEEISNRIGMVRAYSGKSQQEFADSIGVSRVHYNRMEAPGIKMMPSKPLLKRFCEVHGINSDWLLNGEGEMYEDASRPEALLHKEALQKEAQKKEPLPELSEFMLDQTVEYVSLKTKEALKKDSMNETSFLHYVNFFSSATNLFFRLTKEAKAYFATQESLPDEMTNAYISEFQALLSNQKP